MLSYNVLNSWVEKMMKKSLPVKIKTSDITNLSTKDINKLKAGDIVLKKTGNQKHAYIVSYKEENQGICLTYTDASVIETVSYDYNTTTKTWDYNSTDVTPVQSKLTAGSNIQINNGIISATDTTYTAGANISITDGVISSAGGEIIWENEVVLKDPDNHFIAIYFNTKEELTTSNAGTIINQEGSGYRGMIEASPVLTANDLGFNLPVYYDGTNYHKIIPYAFSTSTNSPVYGYYYDGTELKCVTTNFLGWSVYQINSHRLN